MASGELLLDELVADRALQSVVLVAAALVAAWVVDWVLSRVLSRLARRTATDLDDRLIELLHRPVRLSVLVVGLTLATLRLDPSSLVEFGAVDLTALTLDLLATLAIVVWTVAGIRLIGLFFGPAAGRPRFGSEQTAPLVRNLASFVLVAGAVYFVFLTWGIDVTAWIASAGIIGIALGFAAKDSLANFFAGFFILTDAPYKVGDFVNLASGERGQVTQVGIRSTRLLTRDDIEINIPNAIIANDKIANESSGRWTKQRLRIPVGVAYGSDIDLVRRVLEEVAVADPGVCDEPEPRMRFRAFGDSGLDVELHAWIDDPVDRGRVLDSLNTAIYKRFAAEGIEIPYPKRDVYVRELPRSAEPAPPWREEQDREPLADL
jgi:MscS family membrane protein